jgi:hypothetical protein
MFSGYSLNVKQKKTYTFAKSDKYEEGDYFVYDFCDIANLSGTKWTGLHS